MLKTLSTNVKIAVVAVILLVVIVIVYVANTQGDVYNENRGESATNTIQKPLTITEQKNLLNELAKPVSSNTKAFNQDEQVKLLEQLAKPVGDKTIGTSSGTVEIPQAKPFTIDEQMKLLEQLKAR